jgi:hypothetical protein
MCSFFVNVESKWLGYRYGCHLLELILQNGLIIKMIEYVTHIL